MANTAIGNKQRGELCGILRSNVNNAERVPRQASFEEEIGPQCLRVWRLLAWLEDDRVARQERGDDRT